MSADNRILRTKLFIPKLAPDVTHRRRLFTRFDQASGVTLVSAPAGYGKSTVVNDWLKSQPDITSTWISFDKEDNDPARFVRYWLAGLEQIFSSVGEGVRSLLEMPSQPDLISIMDEILNQLFKLSENGVIVVDDYHLIDNPKIHQAVEHFVEFHPEFVRLILISRTDPPFALSRLRASGLLTEIRAAELKFSVDEVTAYLNTAANIELSELAINKLTQRTEGWAAGLQLAALVINNQSDPEKFVEDFSGTHHYIMDYLLDEVLEQQPEQIQAFLKQTARLKRFNADICTHVSGIEQAGKLLLEIEKANLFLIPLDDQHNWYRYHHLFADVLKTHFDREEDRRILQRAAEWFEADGNLDEAIHYYLVVEGYENAARLINKLAEKLIRQGELKTLLNWLNKLPEKHLRVDSDLVAYKALSLVFLGRSSEAQIYVRQAFSEEVMSGRLLAIRAWFANMAGDPQTPEIAQQALSSLGEQELFFRAFALISAGSSMGWQGKLKQSSEYFREAHQLGIRLENPFTAIGSLANLAFNLWEMGNLQEALSICEAALAEYIDSQGEPLPILAIMYAPLSTIYFDLCDFEQARHFAQRGVAIFNRLFSNVMVGGDNEIVLARLAYLSGNIETAYQLINEIAKEARKQQNQMVAYKMLLLKANFDLLQQNVKQSERTIKELSEFLPSEKPKGQQILGHLTARLYIARGEVKEALAMLSELESSSRTDGALRRLLSVQVTQAIAHQEHRDSELAEGVFAEALQLAAAEGYRAPLLPLQARDTLPLLRACRDSNPEFVDSVLQLTLSADDPVDKMQQTLPDPLTDQQIRVLQLLISGLSNQEIADELVITLGTAKWHVHNVLQKLGVSSRAQAIVRAQELGIK